MYIQEVVIEGFKSYATRTVISGWDPAFNAITGLNGTGKSNILDAICFVLGIDNLRQVRATSLQDLVYKRGQAGITKASVTVVFDNSNPAQSPIGYADCPQVTVTRQIVLNGKNKYLINGHSAQQKAVENLFQSVQLNVNNPHFLIMQGQITRVLNMKPEEILAMIEESAGTRMFEDRKLKAIQTLEKKEKKVDEIAVLIADTIEPRLKALRADRSDFLEYKRTEADLERLQRLATAYEHKKISTAIEGTSQTVEEVEQTIAEADKSIRAGHLRLETVNDEILNVTKRKQKEQKASHKIQALEEECRESASLLVRLQAELEDRKSGLHLEEAALAQKQAELEGEQGKLERLQRSLAKIEDHFLTLEGQRKASEADLRRDEDLLRSLETGLSSGGGESTETGYAKLLGDARNRVAQATTGLKQAQQRQKAVQTEIKSMEAAVSKARRDGEALVRRIEGLKVELASLEEAQSSGKVTATATTMTRSSLTATGLQELYEKSTELQGAIAVAQDEADGLQSAIASLQFRYNIADGTFDHSKVKGVVAQLVHLDPTNMSYAQGLEVAAGGRLYNVVVEDEGTAATLLDKGRLTRRVTIIPLNKIQGKRLSADRVAGAEQASQGQARIGLSLIGYEESVSAAMEYVFGSTFICSSKEAAALMAFDRRFGYRAVTVQGDVYEPSGTLSGGSAPPSGGILEKVARFKLLTEQVTALRAKLEHICAQIKAAEAHKRDAISREQEVRTKQQELAALTRQYELDPSGQILEKCSRLGAEVEELASAIRGHHAEQERAQAEVVQYERESSELATDREGKLASLSKRISSAKKMLAKDEAAFKKARDEYTSIQNEIAASTTLISELEGVLRATRARVEELTQEMARLGSEHLEALTLHNGLRVRLDGELRHLQRFDAELKALEATKRHLETTIEEETLARTQNADKLKSLSAQVSQLQGRLSHLLESNPWIHDTHQYRRCPPRSRSLINFRSFGETGGPYDFAQHNMAEVQSRVKSLQAQREALRKTINFNVMDMIDRVEAKDGSLREMLSTVKRDRGKIEGTIGKLNDYMLEALHRTWTKVNLDFGQIFAELLPGSTAKLDPLEGQPITDGLQIKVSLGGVWKQSLAELSGGQRSLVALSLILALLQFKPAPMYILDEVDAALDLSHTENIGRLLRSRFKGSQFIVVSLKEGMFTNANVLFRTRFRDGVSGVDRVQNVPASTEASLLSPKTTAIAGSIAPTKGMARTRARTANNSSAVEAA